MTCFVDTDHSTKFTFQHIFSTQSSALQISVSKIAWGSLNAATTKLHCVVYNNADGIHVPDARRLEDQQADKFYAALLRHQERC